MRQIIPCVLSELHGDICQSWGEAAIA